MSDTLLYIGALLIAFQFVGRIGFASSVLVLPFALPIRPLLNKLTEKSKTKRTFKDVVKQVCLVILFILSTIIFLAVGTALLPIMFIYFFVGLPILWINGVLNLLYRKSLEPWKDVYFIIFHGYLKILNAKTELSDEELWKSTKEKKVPFLAFFGLLCITAGFILRQMN